MQIKTNAFTNYFRSEKWASKKEECLKKSNYTCCKCGSHEHLNVYHTIYNNFENENVEKDLVCLCVECSIKSVYKRLVKICPFANTIKNPEKKYEIYAQYIFVKDILMNAFGPIIIEYFDPALGLQINNFSYKARCVFMSCATKKQYSAKLLFSMKNAQPDIVYVFVDEGEPVISKNEIHIKNTVDKFYFLADPLNGTVNYNLNSDELQDWQKKADRWPHTFMLQNKRKCNMTISDIIFSYEKFKRKGNI